MALLCLCGAAPRVTWQQYRLYHLIRFLPKRAGECTPECGRARCIWAVVHNKISRGQCCYTTPTAKERRKPWSDNATLKIIFKIVLSVTLPLSHRLKCSGRIQPSCHDLGSFILEAQFLSLSGYIEQKSQLRCQSQSCGTVNSPPPLPLLP